MKRAVYGYMRAYEATPEAEVMRDELTLRRWAEREGRTLIRIQQEEVDGSVDGLNELIRELRLNPGAAVVVPSLRHFGDSPVLREHLAAHLMDRADVDVYEAGDR